MEVLLPKERGIVLEVGDSVRFNDTGNVYFVIEMEDEFYLMNPEGCIANGSFNSLDDLIDSILNEDATIYPKKYYQLQLVVK